MRAAVWAVFSFSFSTLALNLWAIESAHALYTTPAQALYIALVTASVTVAAAWPAG